MTPVLMDHFDENPDDVVLIVCVFSGVPACRTSKKKKSQPKIWGIWCTSPQSNQRNLLSDVAYSILAKFCEFSIFLFGSAPHSVDLGRSHALAPCVSVWMVDSTCWIVGSGHWSMKSEPHQPLGY